MLHMSFLYIHFRILYHAVILSIKMYFLSNWQANCVGVSLVPLRQPGSLGLLVCMKVGSSIKKGEGDCAIRVFTTKLACYNRVVWNRMSDSLHSYLMQLAFVFKTSCCCHHHCRCRRHHRYCCWSSLYVSCCIFFSYIDLLRNITTPQRLPFIYINPAISSWQIFHVVDQLGRDSHDWNVFDYWSIQSRLKHSKQQQQRD